VQIKAVKFSDLLPDPAGAALDAHFDRNGWELQLWDNGESSGYQVFFGKGVQVDQHMEYGFPYLYGADELLAFALEFYQKRLAGHAVKERDGNQAGGCGACRHNAGCLVKGMLLFRLFIMTGRDSEYPEHVDALDMSSVCGRWEAQP